MTKVAKIDTRKFVSLLLATAVVVVSLLLALVPRASDAATEGNVTGQFGVTLGALTVANPVLYNEYDNATVTTLDPTSTYVVRVDVTHANTLSFLDNLTVTVYYDADGTFSTGDVPTSGHAQNGVIMTWDGIDNWAIDDGSSSWDIVTAGCVDPTDLGAQNTFTFKFKFTVGTVAKESDDVVGAEWHIYAKGYDTSANPEDGYQENLEMNWYGAITVALSGGSYYTFGNLALGATDSASTNTVNGTYVSNGNYYRNIRTVGTWSGVTYSAPLDTAYDGSPDNGEFCLEADDDSDIDGAIAVQTSYQPIGSSGTITSESGDAVNGMTAWMTLASTGLAVDTYTGTVYYQVSNR